mmetsp:Transcript_20776/g.58497  ORF Transcript_20776/g.58497 Transcript_20776/m.58497 type:complete len:311 (-) Transcript_20776:82-1014(-)
MSSEQAAPSSAKQAAASSASEASASASATERRPRSSSSRRSSRASRSSPSSISPRSDRASAQSAAVDAMRALSSAASRSAKGSSPGWPPAVGLSGPAASAASPADAVEMSSASTSWALAGESKSPHRSRRLGPLAEEPAASMAEGSANTSRSRFKGAAEKLCTVSHNARSAELGRDVVSVLEGVTDDSMRVASGVSEAPLLHTGSAASSAPAQEPPMPPPSPNPLALSCSGLPSKPKGLRGSGSPRGCRHPRPDAVWRGLTVVRRITPARAAGSPSSQMRLTGRMLWEVPLAGLRNASRRSGKRAPEALQ